MAKTSIAADAVVKRIEDIVASDIDNEKVMMSLEKGEYFALDPIGTQIWDILEKPMRVSDLIDLLVPQYDVDRETCQRDILAFLEELREGGILLVEG